MQVPCRFGVRTWVGAVSQGMGRGRPAHVARRVQGGAFTVRLLSRARCGRAWRWGCHRPHVCSSRAFVLSQGQDLRKCLRRQNHIGTGPGCSGLGASRRRYSALESADVGVALQVEGCPGVKCPAAFQRGSGASHPVLPKEFAGTTGRASVSPPQNGAFCLEEVAARAPGNAWNGRDWGRQVCWLPSGFGD